RNPMTAPQAPADATPDPASQGEVGSAPQAENQAGIDPQAEIVALRAELEAAQTEIAALKEQSLRALAESENVRRRAQEDVSKARKFGIESFAESLVPVKDSLEAALAQAEQTVEALREGVEMTHKQLSAAFERNMLKDIAPAQGDKFDPHLHQAIS